MLGTISRMDSRLQPPPRRRRLRATAAASIVLGFAIAGCGGDENTFQAPPPPKVTAIKPPEHTFAPFRDVVATVRSRESVEVRARVDGFLKTREFEPGDLVEVDQTLFTLETDEYEAAVAGATADLRAAKARLQLDQEVLGKYEIAFDKGAASEVELLESKAKVEVSAASVEQAEAKLRRANLDLSYTTIKSPIEGRIGEDLVSIGNLVGSNILNILLVLGATAEVGTLQVSEVVPAHDMWWMLGAAVLVAPLMWLGKGSVGRPAGALYVAVYAAYVYLVVLHG